MKPEEAYTRNLIDRHKITVFVIVIAVLVFFTIKFIDKRKNEKYRSCTWACLGKGKECDIICVQKYK